MKRKYVFSKEKKIRSYKNWHQINSGGTLGKARKTIKDTMEMFDDQRLFEKDPQAYDRKAKKKVAKKGSGKKNGNTGKVSAPKKTGGRDRK